LICLLLSCDQIKLFARLFTLVAIGSFFFPDKFQSTFLLNFPGIHQFPYIMIGPSSFEYFLFALVRTALHSIRSRLSLQLAFYTSYLHSFFRSNASTSVQLPTASIGSFFSPARLFFPLLKSGIQIRRSSGSSTFILIHITFLSISIFLILFIDFPGFAW